MIYVVTLNGHLLPGFLLKNWPEVIAFDWFFVPGKNYLRKKLIALNPNDQTACVRIINRKRCFALIRHYRKTFKNYKKNCDVVAQAYRNNFEVMTSEVFWKGYLGL